MPETNVTLFAPIIGWRTSPGFRFPLLPSASPERQPGFALDDVDGRPAFSLKQIAWEGSERPSEKRYFYVRDDLSQGEIAAGVAEQWDKASPVVC